ncbi:NUDIX domain-containing protein [Litorihabitans aurantiacus]|uniref:NUDIX hydrolase n=1 Tax=Litorihabitans aurantiacus TaxID=1930061 RepID=A0AA37XF50_9MICO|nr:NUDIX hydrolase [Litorihabitans aurantiacus]GMA31640.1 NUDIX hydrolase [Litorihabitans aurantiacus]
MSGPTAAGAADGSLTSGASSVIADERRERPVVASETVLDGAIFDVERRRVDLDEAGVVTREFVTHPGAVAVVALDDEGRVAMIRQYRVPVAAHLWEIPAGLLDAGPEESLLLAAQRELAEEIDLRAARWDVLVDQASSAGMTTEVVRVFLARDLSAAPAGDFVREGEEAEIELRWVPLADAVDAVLAGAVHSVSAVVGLLAAERAQRSGFAALRPVTAASLLRPDVIPA